MSGQELSAREKMRTADGNAIRQVPIAIGKGDPPSNDQTLASARRSASLFGVKASTRKRFTEGRDLPRRRDHSERNGGRLGGCRRNAEGNADSTVVRVVRMLGRILLRRLAVCRGFGVPSALVMAISAGMTRRICDGRVLQGMMQVMEGFPKQRTCQKCGKGSNPDKSFVVRKGNSHFKNLNRS